MSEGWGDALSCDHCGHPASYHGVTFCKVDAGASHKRDCDCPGWKARPSAAASTLDAAWAEVERALPEGWWFDLSRYEHGCRAVGYGPLDLVQNGSGPTPALALLALARRLTGDPAE